MTDERKELIEMVSSMTDEQFTRFLEMAIQDPETRAAVVGILESSAGAVKPINMIDGERDACPALLALYHPFVWHTHFPGFQSEKYIYRILGFGKVLAALSRLRWRAQQSISRGSLGVQCWIFSCFILASTRSHAAFSRLHGGIFKAAFSLCSSFVR